MNIFNTINYCMVKRQKQKYAPFYNKANSNMVGKESAGPKPSLVTNDLQ